MLRILYVLHKNPDGIPGGSELHTLDLLRGFSERRYHVYLMFPGASGITIRDYDETGVRESEYRTAYMSPEELRNKAAEEVFKKILDDFQIDIVHFQHLHGMPISFIEIAKDKGKSTIVSLHDYYFWCLNYNLINFGRNPVSFCNFRKVDEQCYHCLENLGHKVTAGYMESRREYIESIMAKTDIFVSPSTYLRNVFLALYPEAMAEKFIVIEHGLRKSVLHQRENSKKSDMLNIAFLGNFTIEKGSNHYLQIVDFFRDHERVNFSIIGNLERYLEGNPYRNLKLLGGYNRDTLSDILQKEAIDVIILLSVWPETFSFTLSEAISNAIPVIATDLGALRERISKYMVGYLVPYEDPVPRVVKIINDFLSCHELLDYFRKRCIAVARKLPDINSMTDKYEKLYRTLQ